MDQRPVSGAVSGAVSEATAARRYHEVGTAAQVLAAHGPQLQAIVYRELTDALTVATSRRRLREACGRALRLLAGLSADGPLAQVHLHAARLIGRALAENDPKWSQAALDAIAPVADAWGSLRSSA